jgi:surfeit locus 1 family protein
MMIALTLYLSNWQSGRAAQKTALQISFDARVNMASVDLNAAAQIPNSAVELDNLRFRTGIVRGEWLENAQFVIDNKQQNAVPGYHVITPLRLTGLSVDAPMQASNTQPSTAAPNTVILVNRGWVPRTRDYPKLPPIASPTLAQPHAGVLVKGVLVLPSKKYLELGSGTAKIQTPAEQASANTPNQVWQNLDIERIAAATGLKVFPLVMLLNSNIALLKPTSQATPSIVPTGAMVPIEQTETPDTGVAMHRGYAFQWLALAIAIFIVWLTVNIKFNRT